MSLRADRTSTGEQSVQVPDLLGGLHTHVPPHRVPPNASPELNNVLLSRGAVEKRGAMVPLVRQQPGACALQNKGWHQRSRSHGAAGTIEVPFVTVPGCAHAGHRSAWDDADVRNGITLDLFLEVDDLTTHHGGNGTDTATVYGPSPYKVWFRPILSKGPIRRTAEPGAPSMPGTPGWQTTSRWGPISAAHHAMPFCLYLRNNGPINNPSWRIGFAFHWSDGANWHLKTVESDLAAIGGVRIGVLYHVVAGYDIAQNEVVLRVGARFDLGVQHVTVKTTIGVNPQPMALCTTGPIQLFDCPQEFVEAPATPNPTRPPGWGLNSPGDGGYWFGVLRFEGKVEDIVIYRGLVPNADSGALDRTGRIDPDHPPAERLQHWPMGSLNDQMCDEVSGRGNHLYFAPSSPIADQHSGGVGQGTSLVFNGLTAYALAEVSTENPIDDNQQDGRGGNSNWRTQWEQTTADPVLPGAWEYAVKNQTPHGLEVAFWPESIEPNHEQVVIEAHAALRIAVGSDGYIRAYTRDTTAHPGLPGYVLLGQSSQRVVPGQRYHVIALRTSPTSTQLIVNGVLEAFRDVDPSPLASQPVGGLTIGIGARVVTSLTSLAGGQPEASTKPCDMVSTDSRTAFFGRVESFRVLVGGPPLVVGELGTADFVTQYREFLREHYAIPFEHSWILFQSFASLESGETVPGIGLGHVVASALVRDPYGQNASVVRSVTPGSYQIFWPPELTTWPLSSRRFVAVSILRAIAAYDFDAPVDDIGYDDVHDTQVEFRGVPVDADFFKHVHVQRGYVADKLGLLGSIQLRSFEPDLLTESDDKYGDGLWQRRHTPYLLRGPRALQPQWHHGIVPAALGQNPIALLAPWRIEATGEEVLLAACRRTLYWVKPRQKADNPYTDALALWMGGNRGDYCRARGMTAHGFDLDWTEHEAVVDLWIKPDRLDGNRVLVCSGNPLLSDLRYLILLNDGRLEVWGKLADGSHWRWVQGTAQTVPLVQQTAGVAVKLHVWNHVAVRLGDGAVAAWVGGQRVEMVAGNSSSMTAASIAASTDLWIGGVSADQEVVTFAPGLLAAAPYRLQPFSGLIAYAREAGDMTHLGFGLTKNGSPPPRAAALGRWCYDLDADFGWRAPNRGDELAPDLELAPRELVPIASTLGDLGRTPASHIVYRNRLLIAHGSGRPRAVRYLGLERDEKFRVTVLGVVATQEKRYSYQQVRMGFNGSGANWTGNETIEVFMSYVNGATGEESEFASLGRIKGHGVPAEAIEITALPRSPDPDVTSRRFYLSVNDQPLVYAGELPDNHSRATAFRQPAGFGGTVPTPGQQLPAFVADRIDVAQGVVLLAGLKENRNAIAASGVSPGYFPNDRVAALDSKDGQPVVGIAGHLGGVYVFKRNGTWQFQVAGSGGLVFASLRLVNGSTGAAGGTTIYDNVVYGANDRGVWLFDGANFLYVSLTLEGAWAAVDVSDEGLLHQQGAFLYRSSQYWLSVRERGSRANSTVFVLHTGAAQAWTRVTLPEHVVLGRIPGPDDRPVVAIGTVHGQILYHDQDQGVDGLLDVPHAQGAQVVKAEGQLLDPRRIKIANGKFDTTHQGLRGLRVVVRHPTSQALLGVGTVVDNTSDTLRVNFDVPGAPNDPVAFELGGFEGYWTSGWLAPQQMGSWLKAEGIDLHFDPRVGQLRVEAAAASRGVGTHVTFVGGGEVRTVDMAGGRTDQPVPTQAQRHGAFFRFKLSTDGPRTPFAVTAYALRFAPTGTGAAPS